MIATRPNIQARNSSGKQVSLLNDDAGPRSSSSSSSSSFSTAAGRHASMSRTSSDHSRLSVASSPKTPDLLRADSYDSQTTQEPPSPMTPSYLADYGRQPSYTSMSGYYKSAPPPTTLTEERTAYEYPPPYTTTHPYALPERPVYGERRPSSYADYAEYDEDAYAQAPNPAERGTKRYPCRYRDSHHCEKTFTTSGHASRHSKIHTAEKAVHCTFQGCQKKFTRADNMKQHLETHYKSRNGASATASSSHKSTKSASMSSSAGVRKPSRASPGPARSLSQSEISPYDPALYASTERYGSMDMNNVHSALLSRPVPLRVESSGGGLDLLANIAALQN